MIEIATSSSFKKVYKRLIRKNHIVEIKFWECVERFIQDPFDKSLKTHKLSGKLKEL